MATRTITYEVDTDELRTPKKLSWEEVDEIRGKAADPDGPMQTELAEEYGVSQCTISLIVNDKIWTK